MNPSEIALLEAILFVSGKPYPQGALAQHLGVSVAHLAQCVHALQEMWQSEGRGLTIVSLAGSYQLLTAPALKEKLSTIFPPVKRDEMLSRAALETLALVAYRQPISKEEVDQIRGVSSTRSLNILMEQGMIMTEGHSVEPNPLPLYITTSYFLEVFHLAGLEDLPALETSLFNPSYKDEAYDI